MTKMNGVKMKEVSWELALSTAARLAPLREHYVTTRRHNDVASQLNMVLANREMGLTQSKADRKLGLLVVGSTGAGKTTLLKRLVADHPYLQRRNELHLPLISLRVTAPVTNKSLAHQTLRALGFVTDFDTKISAHKYWGWVRDHAEARDACGFLFDEGQDLFLKASDSDAREALSMLKGLMEVPGHPYVVVMSGGPELEEFIEKDPMVSERFYRAVLTPISPNSAFRLLAKEMATLAAMAGMEFGRDVEEIAKRTIHASFNQLGRSLEFVVDGIQEAAFLGKDRVNMGMFADAYHRHTGCGNAQNIFLVGESDWQGLSPIKVTKVIDAPTAERHTSAAETREESIW